MDFLALWCPSWEAVWLWGLCLEATCRRRGTDLGFLGRGSLIFLYCLSFCAARPESDGHSGVRVAQLWWCSRQFWLPAGCTHRQLCVGYDRKFRYHHCTKSLLGWRPVSFPFISCRLCTSLSQIKWGCSNRSVWYNAREWKKSLNYFISNERSYKGFTRVYLENPLSNITPYTYRKIRVGCCKYLQWHLRDQIWK